MRDLGYSPTLTPPFGELIAFIFLKVLVDTLHGALLVAQHNIQNSETWVWEWAVL